MSNYFSIGMDLNTAIQSAVNNANMQAAMNSFMTSSIFTTPTFNFDFSNMQLSNPGMQYTGTPFQFDFSGLTTQTNPFGSAGYVTDENGERVTISEYAEAHGYKESQVAGIYRKDDNYYRYDSNLGRFVKLSATESKAAREADEAADKEAEAQATREAREAKRAEVSQEATSIAADCFDAMKGAGTKNDKLREAISKITPDNVIEVMDKYTELFSESMSGETLLESIQADHHCLWMDNEGQQREIEEHIMHCLEQRARKLGLDSEATAFTQQLNTRFYGTGCTAWWGRHFRRDSQRLPYFNTMIEQIKAKEAEV